MPGYRRSYKRKWIPYARYKAMQRYKRTGRGSSYTARSYARRRTAYKRSYINGRARYVSANDTFRATTYSHSGTKKARSANSPELAQAPVFYKAGSALKSLGKFYSYFDPVIGSTMTAAGGFVTNVYDDKRAEPAAGISNFEKLYDHFLG